MRIVLLRTSFRTRERDVPLVVVAIRRVLRAVKRAGACVERVFARLVVKIKRLLRNVLHCRPFGGARETTEGLSATAYTRHSDGRCTQVSIYDTADESVDLMTN